MMLRSRFWLTLLVIGCGCLLADGADPPKETRQQHDQSLQYFEAAVLLREEKFSQFAELVIKAPMLAKQRNYVQSTLLHEAAVTGHRESAELLLDNGASMECLCIRQLSPFHEAARHDSLSVLELFLERGADINSWGDVDQKGLHEITHQGRETGSPLDRAAQVGAAESVAFLLERGAKLDSAPNGLRFTALHHAMTGMWYHEKESRVSLNKSDRIVLGPKAKLRKLPADGNSVVIKLLVDHGADLRAKDYKGNEPLHIAAGALDAEAIEFVLKEYRSLVDIDAPGVLGWTPLQVAKNSGLFNDPERKERQEKTIATLKKYGARDNL